MGDAVRDLVRGTLEIIGAEEERKAARQEDARAKREAAAIEGASQERVDAIQEEARRLRARRRAAAGAAGADPAVGAPATVSLRDLLDVAEEQERILAGGRLLAQETLRRGRETSRGLRLSSRLSFASGLTTALSAGVSGAQALGQEG